MNLLGLRGEHDDQHAARAHPPAHLQADEGRATSRRARRDRRSSRRSAPAPRGRRWPARSRSRPCAAGTEQRLDGLLVVDEEEYAERVLEHVGSGPGTPSYPAGFRMLDPRSTERPSSRSCSLMVGAFSLGDRPRPIGTTPSPTPSRRRARQPRSVGAPFPGAPGRATAATPPSPPRWPGRSARWALSVGAPAVLRGRDGERQAPADHGHHAAGRPAGPGLVVVAHRDAHSRHGARAELSSSTAMIELANVVRGGRLKRAGDLRIRPAVSQRRAEGTRSRPAPHRTPRRGADPRRPRRHERCAAFVGPALCHGRRASARCSCAGPSRPQCARRRHQPGDVTNSPMGRPGLSGDDGRGPLVAADLPADADAGGWRTPPAAGRSHRPRAHAGVRARRPAHAHRAGQHRRWGGRARAVPWSPCARCCPCGPSGCSSPPCCWRRCWWPWTTSPASPPPPAGRPVGVVARPPRRRR